MTTRLTFFFIIIITLIHFGCEKEQGIIIPEDGTSNNNIRFDELEVGQTSYYLGIKQNQRAMPPQNDYMESGDTLKVWVAEEVSENVFIFMEMMTPGSPNAAASPWDTLTYVVDLTIADTLQLTKFDDSNFDHFNYLFDRTGRNFPLKRMLLTEASIEGRYVIETDFEDGVGQLPGYTQDFQLHGVEYRHLNVIIDNSDMAFDGNGVTLLYSAEDGVVLSLVYNGFSGLGTGWELIPESE